MIQSLLASARIFASHYQLVVCEDSQHVLSDAENWDDDKVKQGYAGSAAFRLVGTEADLNDHWVELVHSPTPPDLDDWQRITCVDFATAGGDVHIMSVVDDVPPISVKVNPGDYAVYVAAQNLGIDQLSLGEACDTPLTDDELAARKDVEWYRIFLVPGRPETLGRIVDR